ncbi:MAG: alanine racemase [Fimbriimonas sp.]
MKLTRQQLCEIINGVLIGSADGPPITGVAIDSRSAHPGVAFFALRGSRLDGHLFVADAFEAGAEVAVVSQGPVPGSEIVGHYIVVDDALLALQRLASWWRNQWRSQVVGVTGSFGKTTVKECLAHILESVGPTYQSPGSFNSQIGVPLAVLRAPAEARFDVLEVGVSEPGEMQPLAGIVKPDYGILTNIGPAHISTFGTEEAIFREKVQLFQGIPAEGWTLVPGKLPYELPDLRCKVYGMGDGADLPVVEAKCSTGLTIRFPDGTTREVRLARDSIHLATNIETAVAAAFLLGATQDQIVSALDTYRPVATRLETWRSSSGVTVISNTHGPDLMSLQTALDHMQAVAAPDSRKFFVFEGGDAEDEIRARASASGVDEVVLGIERAKESLAPRLRWGDVVVVHDQSRTDIDAVATEIVGAMAPNRLFVDLQAIQENIQRFKKHIGEGTGVLAMVKALAYGTEVSHLATAIQGMGIAGFGVSTPDEGVALRRAGFAGELLVMLCTPSEAQKVVEHHLTPVVYSRDILVALADAASAAGRVVPVHLEVDTGMGRTGVLPNTALEMSQAISNCGSLRLTGIMTHFASAEDESKDAFSKQQLQTFTETCELLAANGFAQLVRHAAATSATARFQGAHLDMVRIGIGLYGVYPSEAVKQALPLVPAVALVSQISRVQEYRVGDRIGYGGTFTVEREGFRGAIVPAGYHDGLPWTSSNQGVVLVAGKEARIVGRVSMDSSVIDVSDIPEAQQGTDVLLFGSYQGHELPIEDVARRAGTMSYELLARVGPRVQRIFLGV